MLPGVFRRFEFEAETYVSLACVPLAVRRKLDLAGLKISLDDFGTGYSSLSHLRHLPIDKLKIDLSFIAGVNNDPGDAAITEAIISLGRGLDLTVVAEGVETAAQFEFLRARGCGYGQGTLFGGALAPEQVAALLTAAVPVADRYV